MATKAYVITDKNSSVEGLVTLTGENEITINWADDREDVLSVDEFKALQESDDYAVEEKEITEDETDAQKSIQTHSSADKENGGGQDDGNPKTKWDYMRAILGNLANADMVSLASWNDQVLAQVAPGNFSAVTAGKDAGNKASIAMKPSAAVGSGVTENVLITLQKEEQDAVFGATELTEEARVKITTLFEAAVTLRLTEEAVKLQEQFDAKLEESLTEASETIVASLDQYMNHVVEEFMIENKVAIESSLRSELVHDFITGLKGLFNEHYIDIPEDKVSVVEALSEENDALKAKLNEQENAHIKTKEQIVELRKQVDLATLSEGLTLVQKDKLRKATAEVIYESAEGFAAKVKVIKEGFLGEKSKESNILNEGIVVDETDKIVTPVVDASVAAVVARLKSKSNV